VLQHFLQLTQGRRLLYITDSQAATSAYLNMKGAPGIMEMVRHLYDITADADIQLDVSWRPRTDDAMQHADWLSRSEDAGLIYVPHAALMRICRTAHPGGGIWGLPTVDVFAGRGEHIAPLYFTEFHSPGSLGADAFAFSWSIPGSQGQHPLAWVFAPPGLAINALASRHVRAIVILPQMGGGFCRPICCGTCYRWRQSCRCHISLAFTGRERQGSRAASLP